MRDTNNIFPHLFVKGKWLETIGKWLDYVAKQVKTRVFSLFFIFFLVKGRIVLIKANRTKLKFNHL